MIFVTDIPPYKLDRKDCLLIKDTKPHDTSLDSWIKIIAPEIAKLRIKQSLERNG